MTDMEFSIFAGPAHRSLAHAIAGDLGKPLGACAIERFPDGEVSVRIEETIRGRHLYFVQPTSPPVDVHLFQLLAFIDAARRAGAGRITGIVPYFGYARSDRRHGCREPITARLVGDLLEAAGLDHLVTVDLHTLQIEGFFSIPVDTLTAVPTLCAALSDRLPPDIVVVAPDAGRVTMATDYAEFLRAPLAVLHKRRESGADTSVTHLVGDVRGRACLLIDDMISTGGTVVASVKALRDAGAAAFTVAATHGLLLDGALEKIIASGVGEVVVTDTVPGLDSSEPDLRVVSIATVIARSIRQFERDGSLGELFDQPIPS